MSSKFDRLIAISKMKYLHDQNEFRKVQQRRTDLTKMIGRLDESRYIPAVGLETAATQRHSFRWGSWIDAQQAKVNMELFTVSSDEAQKRTKLEGSYGRYLAIKSIFEDR